MEDVWMVSDEESARARAELERRGFVFLVHFGYANTVSRLRAMDAAIERGDLYDHLRRYVGVTVAE